MPEEKKVLKIPTREDSCCGAGSFWKVKEEIVGKEEKTKTEQINKLFASRELLDYKQRMMGRAIIYAGLIGAAVLTILEAVRGKEGDSRGLHYALLSLPLALGVFNYILNYYKNEADQFFQYTTEGLQRLGVDATEKTAADQSATAVNMENAAPVAKPLPGK